LIETNKYLRDPAQRERLIIRSVETSSAVDGIHYKLKTKLQKGDKKWKLSWKLRNEQ